MGNEIKSRLTVGKSYYVSYKDVDQDTLVYIGEEGERGRFIGKRTDHNGKVCAMREVYTKIIQFSEDQIRLLGSSFRDFYNNNKIDEDNLAYKNLKSQLEEAESLLKGLENK